MKRSLVAIFLVLFILARDGLCQDTHFTQFHRAPLYLNPALTGFMDIGNQRLVLKHRNQWSRVFNNQNTAFLENEAYQSLYLSYEYKFCRDRDYWALGGQVLKDWVGGPSFNILQLHLSIAYYKDLDSDFYLAAAFQGGINQYSFGLNGLRFDAQFDQQDGYLPSLPTMENFNGRNNLWFLDIGGGLLLSKRKNNRDFLTLGASFTHLGAQREFLFLTNTTFPQQEKLKRRLRWTSHLSLYTHMDGIAKKYGSLPDYSIVIRLLYLYQAPHWQFTPMVAFKWNDLPFESYFDDLSLGIGSRLTNNKAKDNLPLLSDAFFISLETHITKEILLGISYDFNISPLMKATNGFGGMELSLSYQFGKEPNCVLCSSF